MRLIIAAWLAWASVAAAQRIYPPVRVHAAPNPGDREYIETAVAVGSRSASHVVVGWLDRTSPGFVRYAVSLDAGRTFVDGLLKPPPCVVGAGSTSFADPMVASSHKTDDLWIGGVQIGLQQQAVNVWRIPAGADFPAEPSVVECRADRFGRSLDKPFIGVGPRADAPDVETIYAFYTDFAGSVQGLLYGKAASDSQTLTWPDQRIDVRRAMPPPAVGVSNEEGLAIVPVVLHGPPHSGRVVCVWRPSQPATGTPVVMYSDDGGLAWQPAAPMALDRCGPSAQPIFPVSPGDLPNDGAGVSLNTVPGIAVDPADASRVYVIFWGTGEPRLAKNVDLFLAQSRDGGETFDPQNTIRLTDALLRDQAAPGMSAIDQILPAIAVDRFHGVNILYYAMTESPGGYLIRPKWARLSSLGPDLTRITIVTKALTPAFPRPILNSGTPALLKEYQMVAASGCIVYACYMSAHDPAGRMNIYVSKINLCVSDVNADGLLDGADMSAFALALAAGGSDADVNGDQAVDGRDVEELLGSLGCDGGP